MTAHTQIMTAHTQIMTAHTQIMTAHTQIMPLAREDQIAPLAREDTDGIAILQLARPAQRNALSAALIAALADELDRIAADPAIACVVLCGDATAFSAGHDLKEMTAHRGDADRGRASYADILTRCSAMMQRIVRLPQPVIAAVEGIATAAGCQLVASCDLAVAGEHARFATPGVNIGLFCSTPMVALARNLARKHAMELLLLGDTTDAAAALRMGLVNAVVPAGTAREAALAMARRIAAKSPHTVSIGKRAFYEQLELGLADAYDHATRVMVENMLHADAAEGIGAFIEKRPPVWARAEPAR